MFARAFCILLCMGILHISALPAPQDSESEVNTSVSSSEPELLDAVSSNENATLIEEGGAGNQTKVGEDTQKPQTNKDLADEAQEESNSKGKEPKDDASDNDEKNDNVNKDEENKLPVNHDEFNDAKLLLSTYAYGRLMNILQQDRDDKKIICHILIDFDRTLLDNQCYTMDASSKVSILETTRGVDNPYDTDIYKCQKISTDEHRTLVELCVTHDAWVWDPVTIRGKLVFNER